MSDLEQTQAIYLEDFGDETDEENEDGKKKIVSFLKVLKQEGFPEKLFPLYEGENIVGRKEDACHVAIPLKALSREHACIEVRGENHLIYDKGSRNKTKRGKLYLIPEVRYELKNKDPLLFGDVKCVYIIGEPEDLDVDDSETGSESGFQTAPTDPPDPGGKRDRTSHVTTLVYDSEEEDEEAYDSDNSVDLLQPTQAYVQKQDGNKKSRINFDMETDEDESDRKSPDITVKETPAPRKTRGLTSTAVVLPESGSETEEEDGEKESAGYKGMLQAPTQAFLAETEGETTEEDSPRKKILCAETQSFLEDKSKKTSSPQGVIVESENEEDKDDDVPVVEIDEDEESEEDRSHLFANPTLACDLPDEVEECEDDQEAEINSNATEEDPEAETQVFTDQTVAISDETLDINVMKSKDRAIAKNNKKTNTKDAATVEIDVNEGNNDETQEFSDVTGGDTLAVDKEECESTQVFDNKTTEAETVAMECEATQVFNEKAAEAETVAVECEATQVFDNEDAKAETVVVECESTQVFDEKISEAGTVAVECEATQVFDEKISEAETVAVECEATQVFDIKAAETETVAVECGATQVFDRNSVNAETIPIEGEETQAVDNELPIIQKEGSDASSEKIISECEPTLVCTDINVPVDDEPEQDKVVPKRGRRGKLSTKSEPKANITEDSEEIQPKRSGRISKRKSVADEEKPVQKSQETKRGRGRKGRGGKHTDVVTEDTDGGGEEISKKDDRSLAEETTTEIDQVDSRTDDSISDKVIDGKESSGQSTTVCDDDIEPTQAYCMDMNDEEGSTTPPISELLGVEVEDGTPVEPVKFVDSEPDILAVPIPPASPHKSALASPGRRSPSPKKVHFQTRESEVVLNEVTGSKLKFEEKEVEEEVSTGRSGGRSRRSLPNLSQPEVPAQGKRGRLSVDPTVEAKAMNVPSTAKGKRGAKSQKAKSEESSSTKKRGRGKNIIAISEEDTPPLEEENNENTDDQKSKEKCVIEEETSSEVSVAEQEVMNNTVGAKGRKGKRGSKAHAAIDKEQDVADTEQQGDSHSQGHGTRKSKDMEKMEESSNSEAKVVKTRRGKRKISETSNENENDELKNSENEDQKSSKKSVVEEATQPYLEESEADETVTETETSKKTRGRKSLAKSGNVQTGRRGAKKSDKDKTEEDSKQTTNENSEKECEMETSKKTGSKRTRKKDLLDNISEETPSNSQQAFSSSSQNVKTRKESEHVSEEVTSDTKSERKGRGKRKEDSKDNAQKSEPCNATESGNSKTNNKRKSAIKQENLEESQDSVLSTESAVTRRGRGRAAQKRTTLSQDSEASSGPSQKSRGRESSATKKVEIESESQEIEDTKDKQTAAVKSASKTRKNNIKDTSSIASDTELSSDSQESTQPKAAPKRGRGRHKTDEAKEEAPVKKTKMEPPSTPQHVKKSAKSSDSPSASLRRKSVDPSKPKIMFTGVTDEHGQKVVKDLGGHLVDSVHECSHLVTDKVRRTVKFLCCLARGIPIVNPQWLDSCKSSGMFVDHTPFLIKDEPAERQYKFALHSSLEKASDSSMLAGYKIHVTKSVKPDPANMKDIITCAGGEYLTTMPKKADDRVLVISCPDDKGICDSALKAGVTVVNAEFILTGILRQENAAENYILFQDKKRSRDSSIGGQPSKKRR